MAAPNSPQGTDDLPSWQQSTDVESRWPVFATVVVIIAGQWWLARVLTLRPEWLFPVVSGLLLATSVALNELPFKQRPDVAAQIISGILVVVLVLANAANLVLLVRDVFVGSPLTPGGLLGAGMVLWVVNVGVFGLLYWELDGGGPEERASGYRAYPDLVFPQQMNPPELTPPDWKPRFGDYLYVSLTSATAFSPTDTMPYSRRAKLAMGIEGTLSIVIAAVLIARAVNIAKVTKP